MALLAQILERSLDDELQRVQDAESRFLASRRILDRFLRSLPIGSDLASKFSALGDIITDLSDKNNAQSDLKQKFMRKTHQSSNTYLIEKRKDEIAAKVKKFCDEKIEKINLAKSIEPQVIIEKRVTTRAGVSEVPDFAKSIDAARATDEQYLDEMIKNVSHEIESKKKLKAELQAKHVSNERIDVLRTQNEKLEEELNLARLERKKWKVSEMSLSFLKTMNEPVDCVKKNDTITLFWEGFDEKDLFHQREDDVAISDPVDSQRAKNAMEIISDFGNFIKNGDLLAAAQLAVSNQILRSMHSFERIIAPRTEVAISAGLWFASVMFESGIMVSQEFILAALDLAHESNISRVVVPQWNSFGIFKPHRKIAEKLENCGLLLLASLMFESLGMYTRCAQLLIRRKQFHQLVKLYKQKHISKPFLLRSFYETASPVLGRALFEIGEESIGTLLLNLITRGFKAQAENFFNSLKDSDQAEAILNDQSLSEDEWNFISKNLTDENVRSKILTQRSLAQAVFEENLRQKEEFDFYT